MGAARAQHFAAIGDYGSDGAAELAVANLVKGHNPEFIITSGDNNYPAGSAATIDVNIGKYFHNYIYPYYGSYNANDPDTATQNHFFPALGNHDLDGQLGQPYFDYFTLPEAYPGNERYYTFVKGNVQFIALNSDSREPDGNTYNSPQAFWLLGVLSASTAPWKIVYFHHAAYSSSAVHGNSPWMQWPFENWGVSAVICGHDHDYERIMEGNIPYFVNGTGGRSLYGFTNPPLPESTVRYNYNYGAMIIDAYADSICFKFYNVNDSLVDKYCIYKTTTGLNSYMQEDGFPLIFPNPNNGNFSILNSETMLEVGIYDALGNLVYHVRVNTSKTIVELFNRPKGIYLLKITGSDTIYTQRIILE